MAARRYLVQHLSSMETCCSPFHPSGRGYRHTTSTDGRIYKWQDGDVLSRRLGLHEVRLDSFLRCQGACTLSCGLIQTHHKERGKPLTANTWQMFCPTGKGPESSKRRPYGEKLGGRNSQLCLLE